MRVAIPTFVGKSRKSRNGLSTLQQPPPFRQKRHLLGNVK